MANNNSPPTDKDVWGSKALPHFQSVQKDINDDIIATALEGITFPLNDESKILLIKNLQREIEKNYGDKTNYEYSDQMKYFLLKDLTKTIAIINKSTSRVPDNKRSPSTSSNPTSSKKLRVVGGKSKTTSLDKCTVAELKERASKRKINVTGLKKAEIIDKLRNK